MAKHVDELSTELKSILSSFSNLHFDKENGKIKCTISGHELPCRVEAVQSYVKGKKFQKLQARDNINFDKYKPHIIPSTKKHHEQQLFCLLTLRHINKTPVHVERHVNGVRYKRALAKWEECQKNGTEFRPNRGQRKKEERKAGGSKGNNSMDIGSEDDEGEISDADSLSDLYPNKDFKGDDENSEENEASDFDFDDTEASGSEQKQVSDSMTGKRKPDKSIETKRKKQQKKKKQKVG